MTLHAKFTARINKLLAMRRTIDSLLFKTINEMTDQSFDSEIFCPEERIKELELRTQRRNNFEEGLFKDRNPYQPYKFRNFIRRAKNMHIFIGCFVYVVDFMILEDSGSIIDSGLSEVVLGQPFARTSKLTYDESLGLISSSHITIHPKQPEESQDNEPDVGQEENGNLGNIDLNPHSQPDPLASIATEQIIRDDDEPQNESPNEGEGTTMEGPAVEYFDTFPTKDKLTYHKYLMCGLIPSIFLQNPIITEGCSSNLKIPCYIGHVHVEKAYIDLNSSLNIMTRMMYNWIMRRKLKPRENANGGISNFIGRIKGIHVFIGNFTYVVDFMIIEDISSIIDPRLLQVVLWRPFIEISNMTHDLPKGVVRFTNGDDVNQPKKCPQR
ncbi:MAK10-like protein [Tanacetum coccineum]